jgi:nitroreductase / dihydropteridine reductase
MYMNISPTQISTILESLNWRYAVKTFNKSKKLTDQQVAFIKESMHLAPSSYGIQAWKFIEIKTPELRQAIKEIGWDQGQYTDASNLFAFCSYVEPVIKAEEIVNLYVNELVEQRGAEVESLEGYKSMMVNAMKNGNTSGDPEYSVYWLQNQLYLALGQTMTACAIAGIDTCPMEGFDIIKANEILGLDKLGLRVNCFLAVGYRDVEDKYANIKKVRNSEESIFLTL